MGFRGKGCEVRELGKIGYIGERCGRCRHDGDKGERWEMGRDWDMGEKGGHAGEEDMRERLGHMG